MILAVVIVPRSALSRLLAFGPLRGLGVISYGIYLWHFPLFLWLDESSTGVRGAGLLGLRVAVTLAVSTLSYFVIEQPIRQRRRPTWVVRALAPVGAGAAFASLLAASAAVSLPVGVPAAAELPKAPPQLRGSTGPCREQLCRHRRIRSRTAGTGQAGEVRVPGAGRLNAPVERIRRDDLRHLPTQAGDVDRRFTRVHARGADDGQRAELRRRVGQRRNARMLLLHQGSAERRWHLGGSARRLPGCSIAVG